MRTRPLQTPAPASDAPVHVGAGWRRLYAHLPQGQRLSQYSWERRHRGILVLLGVQLAGLAAFGIWRGNGVLHTAWETAGLGLLVLAAAWPRLARRWRAVFASGALITCSAFLTHLSGGYIEAHFHFFVMLGVIVLYEDWLPFLLSITYVAVHHGLVGTLDRGSVYNHPAAVAQPWLWAGIHAFFILWLSAALLIYWKSSERAQALTEALLGSTTSGILGLDPSGSVRFANPAAAQILGTSSESLVGRRADQLLARPVAIDVLHPPKPEVARVYRPDGAAVAVSWSVQTLREHGTVTGAIATLNDMTSRVEMEERLRRFNSELEQRVQERTAQLEATMRELEAFNSSVSHDLRTPLRLIRGFTDMALEEHPDGLPPHVAAHLERIRAASTRMQETISALLELSRVTRAPVQRAPVDLSSLSLEVVGRLGELQPARKVRLLVQPDLVAHADPALVHVLMQNLLSNAWKFTQERDEAKIEVGALDQAGVRTFFVRDNGVGFGAEEAQRLFQPFERLEAGLRFEGTGIGLATADRVVRRHGGHIRAQGHAGRGATFYFTLDGEATGPEAGATPLPLVADAPSAQPLAKWVNGADA